MNIRLPFHAETIDEIKQYFNVRALQVKPYGYVWSGLVENMNGIHYTQFSKNGQNYYSLYVPANLRGLNKYRETYEALGKPTILTTYDCGIDNYLLKRKIPFEVTAPHVLWHEYRLISNFYSNKKAKRSDVFLMNHIDEGVGILYKLGAEESAIRAYMIHPYLQSDSDFANNYFQVNSFDKNVLVLALEYRKCANAYLCKPHTDTWTIADLPLYTGEIIKPVRHMLVADKIQNQKDFLKYHFGTHERSDQLSKYFDTWLEYLNIDATTKEWLLQ